MLVSNDVSRFAIFGDKLNWCPRGLSLHDWLVGGNCFCKTVFDELIVGHVDESEPAVYFYMSKDFSTNDYVEDIAKSYMNLADKTASVYCGLTKSDTGILPIKTIRDRKGVLYNISGKTSKL